MPFGTDDSQSAQTGTEGEWDAIVSHGLEQFIGFGAMLTGGVFYRRIGLDTGGGVCREIRLLLVVLVSGRC